MSRSGANRADGPGSLVGFSAISSAFDGQVAIVDGATRTRARMTHSSTGSSLRSRTTWQYLG